MPHPAQLSFDFAIAPATPAAARRGRRWAEHRSLEGGPVRQWVAMPPMDERDTRLSHHTRRTVLLEFAHAGIWLFRAPLRYSWPQDQLERAAELCRAHAAEPRLSLEALRYRLAECLDTTFEVFRPRLGAEPQPEWNVQLCVMARLLDVSLQAGPAAAALPPRPGAVARAALAARRDLEECLANFIAGLCAPVAALATRQGAITGRTYNLLAAAIPGIARNRQQFATTFPLLFAGLMTEPPDPGLPAGLWPAVDRGVALVPFLAHTWGVRKHTIRHLIGKSPEHFGARWSGQIQALLRLLDALPPELRPEQADPWHAINTLLTSAHEEMLGRESPGLVRIWLEHHRLLSGQAGQAPTLTACVHEIALVNEFRAALEECLQVRAATTHKPPQEATGHPRALMQAVLQRRNWRGLLQLATAWRRALLAVRPVHQQRSDILVGRRYAGLLPQPRDYGNRHLVPLRTAHELAQEGLALNHCVGSYAHACQDGTSHIVSLRDRASGAPLSTAEFRLQRQRLGGTRLTLRQHHAHSDRPPSPDCRAAVAALLSDAGSEELQAWWNQLLQALDLRQELDGIGQRRLAAILAPEAALREVLRPAGRYDQLLAQLVAAPAPGRPAGDAPP